jgi:group II intron reverse transcriptase/maturase
MRTAEDVLNVIRDRGRRGLPLEDVYRQLYKPALYLRAYDRLYRHEGAMTRGSTQETVDGMSLEKIETLIVAVRGERYRWTPVRRVDIPKAQQPGKTRPLGIPTWSDKLLQEVIRALLEAYYEPQFSDHSHGFRPERGCHTALTAIKGSWGGTRWFIEGDIKGCFDNIDHTVLLSILRERLHDHRFLRLVANLLQAGYLAQWDYHPTLSGTPQGGVISPLLANIYLDRLDQWVETTLLPEYTRGKRRQESHAYRRIKDQAERQKALGNRAMAHQLEKQLQQMPSKEKEDPRFRRLHYVRYADDFLLGFLGPKAEAGAIKAQLQTFLQEMLKLELSVEKTLITHAATEAARFLGYEIRTQCCDTKHTKGQRSINGKIALRIPARVIAERCAVYQQAGKPVYRTAALHDSDFAIVERFQGEYRGYVQYYQLAENIARLNKLRWVMEVALVKTLARKHTTSGTAIYRQHHGTIQTPHGPRSCLKIIQERDGRPPLVAIFGGIPLRRQKTALLQDQPIYRYEPRRSDLLQRLLAQECEICGATEKIQVHHIRKLADLQRKDRKAKPLWVQRMATRRRKTLILCQPCHQQLHAGTLQSPSRTD